MIHRLNPVFKDSSGAGDEAPSCIGEFSTCNVGVRLTPAGKLILQRSRKIISDLQPKPYPKKHGSRWSVCHARKLPPSPERRLPGLKRPLCALKGT